MLVDRTAVVTSILRADAQVAELHVRADGEEIERPAVSYTALTGPIALGDRVTINCTATALNLGTGGVDFVIANLSSAESAHSATLGDPVGDEHIIKLRYTPHQHAVRTVEMEPDYADALKSAEEIGGTPVVVGSLHSQIAPIAASVKAANAALKVAYVMTDSAALPLAFSRLVRDLVKAGLIDDTLTCGQAFGGKYECVTFPSALVAAQHVAQADVIVVAPGPGNAGTGTRYGFSGVEQGSLLTIAGQLAGSPFGVLRLSLADERPRHRGVSHHSVTALGRFALPCRVAFPRDVPGVDRRDQMDILATVQEGPIGQRHQIVYADATAGLALLEARGIHIRSMGRGVVDDPLFFHASGAAGAAAAALLI